MPDPGFINLDDLAYRLQSIVFSHCVGRNRVPTKPAMHSNSKPAGYSDRKPGHLGVNRMGRFDDVEG